MDQTKKNSIKEKFILQKQTIEKQSQRIAELEKMLIPPAVAEISTQFNYEEPKKQLSFSSNECISEPPDALMPLDKVKELERITSQLQEELRNCRSENENSSASFKKEKNNLTKKIAQMESANAALHKEIEKLTGIQLQLQAEVRKLNADLTERQSILERLQDSQRKLTRENADLDQAQQMHENLLDQINELKKEKAKSEEELSKFKIKCNNQEKQLAQSESKFRTELASLSDKVAQSRTKDKENEEKLKSAEASTKRYYQKVAELESMLNSLQTKNEELTSSNVQLITELNTIKQKASESQAPTQELKQLKSQIATLRREEQTAKEKQKLCEQRAETAERKADALSKDLKKMTETLGNSIGGSSVDEAITKMNEMKVELKQSQKECSDLKIQIAHTKNLKGEIQESSKRTASLQQNLDFMQARIDYIKQVVMQLLTSPFSQRKKVTEVLVDLLSYTAQEKETILNSPANSGAITSRLLYAFEPFV